MYQTHVWYVKPRCRDRSPPVSNPFFANRGERYRLKELLAIAVAGALGSLGRYGVNVWSARTFEGGFYYATFFVNVIGCFALGLLMQVGAESGFPPRAARLALGVGFLGAFTTFSTFGYETVHAAESGSPATAVTIVLSNVVVGLAAVWGGIALGRMLVEGS
jgi:CrcB protein